MPGWYKGLTLSTTVFHIYITYGLYLYKLIFQSWMKTNITQEKIVPIYETVDCKINTLTLRLFVTIWNYKNPNKTIELWLYRDQFSPGEGLNLTAHLQKFSILIETDFLHEGYLPCLFHTKIICCFKHWKVKDFRVIKKMS